MTMTVRWAPIILPSRLFRTVPRLDGLEFVAHAPAGVQVLPPMLLQLVPQPRDVAVAGAGVAGVLVAPQLHQQPRPLQGPPPARGHNPKQVELPPGQLHGPAPGAAGAA